MTNLTNWKREIHLPIPHFSLLILDLINKRHFPPCLLCIAALKKGYRWRARDLTQAHRDPSHIALGAVGINVAYQHTCCATKHEIPWRSVNCEMGQTAFKILRRGCSCRTRRLEWMVSVVLMWQEKSWKMLRWEGGLWIMMVGSGWFL